MAEEQRDIQEHESSSETVDRERRKILNRLGKFAVYAPPTLLALYTSKDAVASGPTDGGP